MRRSPMKPGKGFKRAVPPLPPKQVHDYEGPKREKRGQMLRVDDASARLTVPIPKFNYVRDTRLRDMCRAMRCMHCGACGPDAGVTWAHSNQGIHGHARSIKASDVFVAAMCWPCHSELDQGKRWSRALKVEIWNRAFAETVRWAHLTGTWPVGIPVPNVEPRDSVPVTLEVVE